MAPTNLEKPKNLEVSMPHSEEEFEVVSDDSSIKNELQEPAKRLGTKVEIQIQSPIFYMPKKPVSTSSTIKNLNTKTTLTKGKFINFESSDVKHKHIDIKTRRPLETVKKVIPEVVVSLPIENASEPPKKIVRERKNSCNTTAVTICLLFKCLAVLMYIFSSLIFSKNEKTFKLLFIIIFGSFDFWVTKNICGRLLVGLLWRKVVVKGEEKWLFECRVDEDLNNQLDTVVFWGSMVLNVAIWAILLVLNVMTFSFKAFICIIPIVLTLINFGSFIKCSRGTYIIFS